MKEMKEMKDMQEMKKCNRCGETKAHSKFYKSKQSKDGLSSWCKECYDENKINRKFSKNAIKEIRCRVCRGIYPSPFLTNISREYDPYIWEKGEPEGVCIFCGLKEKYAEAIELHKSIYEGIIGYKCPNPDCQTIHFYHPKVPLNSKKIEVGYIYSEPEKKFRKTAQMNPLHLAGQSGHNRSHYTSEKDYLRCKKCGRSYLEDRWEIIPEEMILEPQYILLKSSHNPRYIKYCEEMEEAKKNLITIKDFNCTRNGVCGILERHHISLMYDPERLSSDFLLGLISGDKAKEDYLKARAKRN